METGRPGDAAIRPRLFPGKAPFQGDHEIKIISGRERDHEPSLEELLKVVL